MAVSFSDMRCFFFMNVVFYESKLLFSGASIVGGVAALGSPSGGAGTAERR